MDNLVQELFEQGISKATFAVYRSGWRHYVQFCSTIAHPPLPLTEDTLCRFAAMMSQTVAWGTVRIYISALRYFQIRAGLPDPSVSSFPRLSYVLKGIHRTTPDHHRKQRFPITIQILTALHTVWAPPPVSYNNAMLWAACCLGFFGFLRAGEFTCTGSAATDFPLTPSDIVVDSRENPQQIAVHLRRSKTDPFGVGCHIYLGRTHTIPCPVAAVLGYLSLRPPIHGPLFIYQGGMPLTRDSLVQHLRAALVQAGIDSSSYSGHSFRIGAATAARQAGYSDSLIQTLGRWKSSAFLSYLRSSPDELVTVAATLVRQGR